MDDLNDVLALLLNEHPDRAATSHALAVQIETRDLWRCPVDRAHPAAWHLEVWVRSGHGRGRFVLDRGMIALCGTGTCMEPGWRLTA